MGRRFTAGNEFAVSRGRGCQGPTDLSDLTCSMRNGIAGSPVRGSRAGEALKCMFFRRLLSQGRITRHSDRSRIV